MTKLVQIIRNSYLKFRPTATSTSSIPVARAGVVVGATVVGFNVAIIDGVVVVVAFIAAIGVVVVVVVVGVVVVVVVVDPELKKKNSIFF